MPSKTSNYEDKFSGKTKAIIKTLTHIFLDSNLDVREKHMFGHKAFLIHGHMMMMVGEWSRLEKLKDGIVQMDGKGEAEPTLIILPRDEASAKTFQKKYGGLYFAPSGVRLKNWLSFTGPWLSDEAALIPLVIELLNAAKALPPKEMKNPGRIV
jgi:hypothetical protein